MTVMDTTIKKKKSTKIIIVIRAKFCLSFIEESQLNTEWFVYSSNDVIQLLNLKVLGYYMPYLASDVYFIFIHILFLFFVLDFFVHWVFYPR